MLPARKIHKAYRKLRKLVEQERPDVVLALPEKVNVWTVLYLLGSGVPVVVSERNDPHRHPESRIKRILRCLVYPFAKASSSRPRKLRAIFRAAFSSAASSSTIRWTRAVSPRGFPASASAPSSLRADCMHRRISIC